MEPIDYLSNLSGHQKVKEIIRQGGSETIKIKPDKSYQNIVTYTPAESQPIFSFF